MSTLPDNVLDLEKLFLPSWAQEPASVNRYAKFAGEERRDDRRDDRRGRRGRPQRSNPNAQSRRRTRRGDAQINGVVILRGACRVHHVRHDRLHRIARPRLLQRTNGACVIIGVVVRPLATLVAHAIPEHCQWQTRIIVVYHGPAHEAAYVDLREVGEAGF